MSLLKWSLIFLVIAGIAALFGFGNVAEGAADISKMLFYLFAAIFVVLLILGFATYKKVT